MHYTYIILFRNNKFYRSCHDYVSTEYDYCDKSDATILEEDDLRFLIKNANIPLDTFVEVFLGDFFVGIVGVEHIIHAID